MKVSLLMFHLSLPGVFKNSLSGLIFQEWFLSTPSCEYLFIKVLCLKKKKLANEKENYTSYSQLLKFSVPLRQDYNHNLEGISQICVFWLRFSAVTVFCLTVDFSHELFASIIQNEGFMFQIACIAEGSFTEVMHL